MDVGNEITNLMCWIGCDQSYSNFATCMGGGCDLEHAKYVCLSDIK